MVDGMLPEKNLVVAHVVACNESHEGGKKTETSGLHELKS